MIRIERGSGILTLFCALFLCVLMCSSCLFLQKPIHLAYSDEGVGCVFLGSLHGKQFVTAPELKSKDERRYVTSATRILKEFEKGKSYSGYDDAGYPIRVIVFNTDPATDQLGFYTIDVDFEIGTQRNIGLFGTKALPINVLQYPLTHLAPEIDQELRAEADRLWAKHLLERLADDTRPLEYRLLPPKVTRIEQMLSVLYPMEIYVASEEVVMGNDDRGSMFFFYSLMDQKIVRGEFGHPEWSPGSTVLTIIPKFYFSIADDHERYVLARYSGGWEDHGNAILDVRTGRALLICY